jgi:two-component system, NarL family, sensor histidine kinase UhpB
VAGRTPIRTPLLRFKRSPWRSQASNFVWFGRSLRTQILIVFVALSLVAASVAGGVIIFKAGVSTRIEIAASMRLARLMVNEAVQLIAQGLPAEQFLRRLPEQMRFVRHVRIEVHSAGGQPPSDRRQENASQENASQEDPNQENSHQDATHQDATHQETTHDARSQLPRGDSRAAAPAWFAKLIGPPVERHEAAVVAAGRRLGTVEIISEPRDEIAEVWGNTVALAAVAATTEMSIIAILYFVLGRVLDPLRALGTGLRGLERRDYEVRLARPKVLEFAALADRFNALAGALDAVRTENLALNRRLITAQDDERRRTALELHDEVGPSLFGLKANVASIARAAGGLPDAAATVAERVRDLTAIIDHLQGINRAMLNRLRPMALGNLPLADIIAGLVRDRAREHPHIAFTHDIGPLDRSYDDTVDLTVYRCVQESLTNAIRHAKAKSVAVKVVIRGADDCGPQGGRGDSLELTVRDDGFGIPAGQVPGFGLRGMQERVQALGGEFVIGAGNNLTGNDLTGTGPTVTGTGVRIVIPLPPRPADSSPSGCHASTSP